MDGFYINLDRSLDRRAAMDAQLEALGMPWVRRLAAVDGAAHPPPAGSPLGAGERACFASHAQAIAAPSAGGLRLVLEDDIEMARDLPAIITGFGLSQLEAFDLVFLDCQPQVNATVLMTLWNSLHTHRVDADAGRVSGVNLYNAELLYHFGATGYLVTPAGRSRIPPLLQAELQAGPSLPIDMWFARMCHERQLNMAVVAPFLVTPVLASYAASTVLHRPAPPPESIGMNGLRRLFFAGEWASVQPYAAAWLAARDSDDAQLNLITALFMKLNARGFVAEAQLAARSPSA